MLKYSRHSKRRMALYGISEQDVAVIVNEGQKESLTQAGRVSFTWPSGDLWHRDLLKQMSHEKKDVRPAIISGGSFASLDELRRFRHLVRNVYTFNLAPEKVEPIISDLDALWSKVRAELLAFADFLEQAA